MANNGTKLATTIKQSKHTLTTLLKEGEMAKQEELEKTASGAVIIARKPDTIDGRSGDVVLCVWKKNNRNEYVTWNMAIKTRACVWGHYFGRDIDAAVKDYIKRDY